MKRLFLIAFALAIVCVALPKDTKADETTQDYQQIRQENEREAAQLRKSYELTAKAEALKGKKVGQCVIGVRQFLGIDRSQIAGLARNTKINSRQPTIGAIIVTRESWAGHVGVVLQVVGDKVLIYETNYHWNGRAGTRWISINSKKIVGYRIINL